MNLKDQLTAIQTSMKTIVDDVKAANRDLTDAEMTTLEAKASEAIALKAKIERADAAADIMARVGGMKNDRVDAITGEPSTDGGKGWGRKATSALSGLAARVPGGAKALTSGTVSVPAIVTPVVEEAPTRTLLDLISVIAGPGRGGVGLTDTDDAPSFVTGNGRMGNGFSFLRQILRTNNAGAVPDLGEKPVSTYTFDQIDDKYRVYANKTEDLPWRYLEDFSDLAAILNAQLREDTLAAIERDVIDGDGEGDRFKGILNSSGIQTQAFTGTLVDTLNAAKWKLLAQDRQLTGWALNPLDLRNLEMLRENGDTGAFLFKSRADIEGFLGAPVVTSLGLPLGTAMAADWTQAELLPYGDDELVFDGKNRTENNTFRIMFEGRYGFRIKKPFDFVKVELTDQS